MFFAAKEAVARKARERGRLEGWQEGRQEGRLEGRQEGRLEGRQEERARISKVLERHGVILTPELAKSLAGDAE